MASQSSNPTQKFLDPNRYTNLSITTQPTVPPSPAFTQAPMSASSHTRASSRRIKQNTNTAHEAPNIAQHDVQRYEDPNKPDPGEKDDFEYAATGGQTKRKKRKGPPTAVESNRVQAQVVGQGQVHLHQSTSTQPAFPSPLGTSTPLQSVQQIPGYHHSFYGGQGFTSATVVPPSMGLAAVPMSLAVPMAIWSNSSSPHGEISHANFSHSVSPTTTSNYIARPTVPTTPSPVVTGLGQSHSSPEDSESDDDNDPHGASFAPFNPVIAHVAAPTPQHHSVPLDDATNNTLSTNETDLMTASRDHDDILESVRNKTKRRRKPLSRLSRAAGSTPTDTSTIEGVRSDPTNLNAYNNDERPFLHLSRACCAALLVTREAMPASRTARNFQIDAYEEAGCLLKTGIPSSLPSEPTDVIL
ncbi:hypothetical protein FRB90_003078 [Tulasnella sp. 427]|nr:hypothetical protein FRB90_003078 [Tulasnella sp. 427]